MQMEVNLASLRAAVHFLDRLELRSLDGNSGGDEVGHVASRLFIRYTNSIMRPLDFFCPPAQDDASEHLLNSQRGRGSEMVLEVHKLVVKGLAWLISTNTESGVKHSLAFAYDQDVTKKVIFVKVFVWVMGQGTKQLLLSFWKATHL
ncbi:hypothetical protein K488DRAFT_62612 [Vararia minispora EC-137]|uniref:Uncharacterized protein n=1 Tax=Vararia minispora EC-137 TaxID=1314806 RepID=A0ACB8Q673_9AGAM|nr:hypothetical protein K488DRAFT_62612 [Vararia minispora EC-137]